MLKFNNHKKCNTSKNGILFKNFNHTIKYYKQGKTPEEIRKTFNI
jgi:hypothetical protein